MFYKIPTSDRTDTTDTTDTADTTHTTDTTCQDITETHNRHNGPNVLHAHPKCYLNAIWMLSGAAKHTNRKRKP